jgi:hypothetical protein
MLKRVPDTQYSAPKSLNLGLVNRQSETKSSHHRLVNTQKDLFSSHHRLANRPKRLFSSHRGLVNRPKRLFWPIHQSKKRPFLSQNEHPDKANIRVKILLTNH